MFKKLAKGLYIYKLIDSGLAVAYGSIKKSCDKVKNNLEVNSAFGLKKDIQRNWTGANKTYSYCLIYLKHLRKSKLLERIRPTTNREKKF